MGEGISAIDGLPFLDLRSMNDEVAPALEAAWHAVTTSHAFIGGPYVERFEAEWAAYNEVEHCVGVGNGTDAITLALAGLGIGPGDEVIVPANTFIATATAVTATGAVPVFVDVDPATLLVTADHIRAALGPRVAAVVVVHLYGQMADMDAITQVTRRASIAVVEDAAQAHGATWRGSKPGRYGDAATFSFYPGKNLGAFGDAGAVITRDHALVERIRLSANHGRSPSDRFVHVTDGRNSRLDGLQAAILSAKLPQLDRWNEERRRAHVRYAELLRRTCARQPAVAEDAGAVHHVEAVLLPDRDRVAARLRDHSIDTNIHYPIPCHRQPAFAHLGTGRLPVVEAAAREELSLPMYPHLTDAEIGRICAQLAIELGEQPDIHG